MSNDNFIMQITELLQGLGFSNVFIEQTRVSESLFAFFLRTLKVENEEPEILEHMREEFEYYKVKTKQGVFGIYMFAITPVLDFTESGISLVEFYQNDNISSFPVDYPNIAFISPDHLEIKHLFSLLTEK